ncbi:hypothetical protein GCM10008014_42320 [Paenibacillus silvae]|uniref:Uncharacterized protein n=1 Tax=Paenibacillus silvae TaxID=1325358 RepID=A0ABQ1ZIJ8_9BACL|nr:hypothetical protein GCM10008014_42320 [Paenibacillus silvae]
MSEKAEGVEFSFQARKFPQACQSPSTEGYTAEAKRWYKMHFSGSQDTPSKA